MQAGPTDLNVVVCTAHFLQIVLKNALGGWCLQTQPTNFNVVLCTANFLLKCLENDWGAHIVKETTKHFFGSLPLRP